MDEDLLNSHDASEAQVSKKGIMKLQFSDCIYIYIYVDIYVYTYVYNITTMLGNVQMAIGKPRLFK